MTNVEIMVSRIMIMIMNRYQTIIPIDKAKVVTKQQNVSKIKLKIKQYNMDV